MASDALPSSIGVYGDWPGCAFVGCGLLGWAAADCQHEDEGEDVVEDEDADTDAAVANALIATGVVVCADEIVMRWYHAELREPHAICSTKLQGQSFLDSRSTPGLGIGGSGS